MASDGRMLVRTVEASRGGPTPTQLGPWPSLDGSSVCVCVCVCVCCVGVGSPYCVRPVCGQNGAAAGRVPGCGWPGWVDLAVFGRFSSPGAVFSGCGMLLEVCYGF